LPDNIRYGTDNPHPLSTLRTELVWEGKYDEYGNRREVEIAGLAMPLQKIETVDEPRQRAEGQRQLFEPEKAHRDDFRNMLIWGDNKLVMASLLKDYKGEIDLIYIDPPFDVGADFTMDVPVGAEDDSIEKDQSTLEMVAYRDMWGRGTDSYIQMMYERLAIIKELLAESGSIFVHCDWRVNSLLRLVMADIFGQSNMRNEIAWRRANTKTPGVKLGVIHDTIYWFSKSDTPKFRMQYHAFKDDYEERKFPHIEEDGRRYQLQPLHGKGSGEPRRFGDRVIAPPRGRHWSWSQDRIDEAMAAGIIVFPNSGEGYPRYKDYFEGKQGIPLQTIWNDIPDVNSQAFEKEDYATQKPEGLLERILQTCSDEGDLIADFFCGSGTAGSVAERLGRRWIMCDLGRFAIHTSRKRLIELQRRLNDDGQPYRSFDVYNLGRYERQWWQSTHLNGADEEHRRVVLEFYRAEPLHDAPSPLLHGRKGSTWVHVNSVDSIFTRDEVTNVAMATKEAGAREVACLSWEFEMDLRLTCNRLEQELGVKIKLIQIPREIMEKNRTSPPPFLEVATLQAELVLREVGGKRVTDIKLTTFLPSLAEVPSKELAALKERAINSGFDFIDFWAVDFDYSHGRPFNHDWQAYRTRKDRSLPTVSDLGYEYSSIRPHTACVKVVDVFGCDTSITVEVPA